MIPVPQRIVGRLRDEQRGDCFKCCVASVLHRNYEEVPHFVQQEEAKRRYHIDLLNDWLAEEGYLIRCMYQHAAPAEPFVPCQLWIDGSSEGWRPHIPGWWIATVRSKRFPGAGHSVVMHDNRVAFDPSPLTGTPEYDEKPYEYGGWAHIFYAPEPWLCRPVATIAVETR